MRAVIQRVRESSVTVDGQIVGQIGRGFLLLLGIETGDSVADSEYLVQKVASLRVFPDDQGKMNLDILQTGGKVLVVSQFTLVGDCRKGRRPSFASAAAPEVAKPMYEEFCDLLRRAGLAVEQGVFAADMQVHLVNDGPVTILLDSGKKF